MFIIMNARIISIIRACSRWETVDLALRDKCSMWTNPRLIDIQEFKRVLFLVFPFHVFLFITDRIPPYIQKTIGPCAAFNEERTKIETGTVLGDYEIYGARFAVSDYAARFGIEVGRLERVRYVEWVIFVDIAVGIFR